MLIKCWGSRGSIPVSGKEFLVYGGDTTCIEIQSKNNAVIIVDAGSGIRRLGNHLIKKQQFEYSVIFTHAHWDHLLGFPFFKPLYKKRAKISMMGCPFSRQYIEKLISEIMTPPYFPIDPSAILAKVEYLPACPAKFKIDSITVTPIALSHPGSGSGYKFEEDGKTFIFLSDNELGFSHPDGETFETYLDFCQNADLLMHDAEFTPEEYKHTRGWGHTVYPRAVELGARAKVKKLGLFHLNQDRTDSQVDEIVKDSCRILEKLGSDTKCFAVACDAVFEL